MTRAEKNQQIFRIRAFIPADREFILSLVPRFSEFNLPEWRDANEINNTNRNALINAIDQPEQDVAILVAEDDAGAPLGFIHLQTKKDLFSGEKIGYISDLAVDKSFEGAGIGRMLLEAAEAWARQNGYRLLALYVFAENTRAQRVYEKQGFGREIVKYVKKVVS